jgi:glycosyltransferase involved in cell wall biosynthesis
MRVLHAPTNIGANPQSLAVAERALGLQSHAVCFRLNSFAMQTDEVLWLQGTGPLEQLSRQWQLIQRAGRDFDLVHYNGGRSMAQVLPPRTDLAPTKPKRWAVAAYNLYAARLQHWELSRLNRLGKPIFVTYQGDEARPGTQYLEWLGGQADAKQRAHSAALWRFRQQQIALFDRYADKIYALNPDLCHNLPARTEFLPYASVDPKVFALCQPERASQGHRPKIVHAPSNRLVKGSDYLLSALAELEAEGLGFELVLVENMPHAEALRAYQQADLVVDQLRIGWYGAFAVEVMAMGKPVVCFLKDEDFGVLPPAMRQDLSAPLPFINADTARIKDKLRAVLQAMAAPAGSPQAFDFAAAAGAARAYAEAWHDPAKIARRLADDYQAALDTVNPPSA